jgi:hypothetical protein
MTNSGTEEDKRDAVNIGVNLSNQLITTSLALIAVVGAAMTFIMQQKEVGFWFYCCSIISFFSLLSSIFCGGRGINTARNNGFKGNWTISEGKDWFDWQAKLTLVGVICLCFLFFTGNEKGLSLEKAQIETNRLLLEQIQQTNKILTKVTQDLDANYIEVDKRLNSKADTLSSKHKSIN